MKNLRIGRVKPSILAEFSDADEFAVHPVLQTVAISTKKELILLEDIENSVISGRFNWENERNGAGIANLMFRSDGSQLIAVLTDGRALVLEENELMEVAVAEISDDCYAEWSSDEQTLAIADNFNFYLADMSLMVFSERLLIFEGETLKKAPVNVGWGSESTQFRGSAGKLKPGEPLEQARELLPHHSTAPILHWRQDGELVVLSYCSAPDSARKMAVFDKNGEILNFMNTRTVQLSHCFALRPNANLICAATLQKGAESDGLVFYERNGETRNSYAVKWPRNQSDGGRKIEKIEWNSTGSILAIQTDDSGAQMLEFWQLSNFEFNRKLAWKLAEPIIWKWSPTDSDVIDVLLPTSSNFFSILLSATSSFSDVICGNVVVATDELRMYSLCRRVVPPPMADHSIQCVADVVVYTTTPRHLHVILTDGKIVSYSQDPNGYQFDTDRVAIASTLPHQIANSLICDFVYDEPSESYVVWWIHQGKHVISRIGSTLETLLEADDVAWIGVNPYTQRVEYATNKGAFYEMEHLEHSEHKELFRIDPFDTIEVHFTEKEHVILANNSQLFLSSQKVAQDAVSVLVRGSDVILIDFDNKLRFLSALTGSAEPEDVRDVEAGCELVACSASSSNVVLQAARGNLETIQPRRYVMAETRRLLETQKYVEAFRFMKKHRIDMSFAMSHLGARLEHDVQLWLTRDSQLLEQLVVSCTEQFGAGAQRLCDTVYEHVKGLEDLEQKTALFPLMLTALLRSTPSREKVALKEVQEHVKSIESRKDVFTRQSLHHISFFLPAKELFNCALSTYDLKLAQQVGEASNYDPKEYLPVLNKLNKVEHQLERQYRINVVREAWLDAVGSLFELETEQNEEKWWEEAKEIIQREGLFQKALSILNPQHKRYRSCCELYGVELERKVMWKEAALFHELAGGVEKTLKCWEMARDVDGLVAAARRIGVEEKGKLKIHALKMSAALRESRQPKELAKALKLAGSPQSQVLQALCDAFEWTEASRETTSSDEVLQKMSTARLEQIQMDLTRRAAEFEKYRERLSTVRASKLKRVEQFAAGEVEDLRDDISVISSISSKSGSSRVSMASTVRRKKQIEKKKASLKEGGEYEDSALLGVLAEQYRWAETVGNELIQLIPVLITVGKFAEAIQMRSDYSEFTTKLQKAKQSVWPENLAIQHLPGPLYALFDPNQEPSPIPMPPIFRLEPELIAPNSNFPIVFP